MPSSIILSSSCSLTVGPPSWMTQRRQVAQELHSLGTMTPSCSARMKSWGCPGRGSTSSSWARSWTSGLGMVDRLLHLLKLIDFGAENDEDPFLSMNSVFMAFMAAGVNLYALEIARLGWWPISTLPVFDSGVLMTRSCPQASSSRPPLGRRSAWSRPINTSMASPRGRFSSPLVYCGNNLYASSMFSGP